MNVKRLLAMAFLFCAPLSACMLWCSGWRMESPRIAPKLAPRSITYSPDECRRYCESAALPLPGLTPAMTADDLRRRLTTAYGPETAAVLVKEFDTNHMLVGDGKLFFPTDDLCRQTSLEGECATLCARSNRMH